MRIFDKAVLGIALATGLLTSCAPSNSTKDEAVDAARDYLWKEHKLDFRNKSATVHDDGETWIVSFRGSPDATGGSALVQLDKRDCIVVGVTIGQ